MIRLSMKHKLAIRRYAVSKIKVADFNEYGLMYHAMNLAIEAVTMKRENLYKYLTKRGYVWDGFDWSVPGPAVKDGS